MSDPTAAPTSEPRRTSLAWLAGTMAAAIMVRLVLWLGYSPVPYSDTPSYRRLAESVLNGFAHYDGTRTPGYPAFLSLIGSDQNVWLAQMGFGALISAILFYLGWRLSGRGWFGALVALAHTANLGQLFFEANLLTETLTTFCLALVFGGVFILLRHEKRIYWGVAAGVGLAASLALLTRPLFVYLPVWVGVFLAWGPPPYPPPFSKTENGGGGEKASNIVTTSVVIRRWRCEQINLKRLITFTLPVLLLVGGWVLFIHQRFGIWGLTTMTGYHLVQHAGEYFEYVPDEYAALRDTYLQYRDAKIAATGTQTNAIWEAIPALSQVSGLDFYELSRTLVSISVRLILEHPSRFLRNVAEGWWMFWRAPVYWSPEALHAPALAGTISAMVTFLRISLVVVNFIFVICSLVWAAVCYLPARLVERMPGSFRRLRSAFHPTAGFAWPAQAEQRFMLFLAGNIWITSILQSLLDHGDNPRFLLPLQSFVVLWVAWFILKKLVRSGIIPTSGHL